MIEIDEYTDDFDVVLENFRETIETAAKHLREISDEESAKPVSDDKWSAKEMIGHLIDSAANNHQRFVRGQFQRDLIFQGYNQDDWVSSQRYNDASWSLLIELWRTYNLHLHHVMAHSSKEARTQIHHDHTLNKIAFKMVSVDEPSTLEYIMRDYIVHLKSHLKQVPRTEF
jgi:hypothetical protein